MLWGLTGQGGDAEVGQRWLVAQAVASSGCHQWGLSIAVWSQLLCDLGETGRQGRVMTSKKLVKL